MKQPPGYEAHRADLACRLLKALYGLKQSPRVWQLHMIQTLQGWRFISADADKCMFIRECKEGILVLLAYVDDFELSGPNGLKALDAAETYLQEHFELKRVPGDSEFLGISIARNCATHSVHLNQQRYTLEVLQRFRHADAAPVATPAEPGVKLVKHAEGNRECTSEPYAEAVGVMLYLAGCTRPDIAQTVNALSRYVSAPRLSHWRAAKWLLRYLKGTYTHGIRYGGDVTDVNTAEELPIVIYCDADYTGDLDTRRSTTAYVSMVVGGALSWKSQLQPMVVTSTTEAEYMAAGAGSKEALWLRKLWADLRLTRGPVAMRMFGDNQSALALIKNPVHHQRTKHIDIIHHAVRERVVRGEVMFAFCPAQDMLADVLTKGLPAPVFQRLHRAMGVVVR
jgi:hypothetical protein